MSDPRAKTYRPWNPDAYRQQTHSPDAKLPEDDLVFFLLDLVPQLDLTAITAPYEQELRGAPPFDPALMTCLLLYAYGVGVYSSRKIARACERNLAFLAIVGDDRPDLGVMVAALKPLSWKKPPRQRADGRDRDALLLAQFGVAETPAIAR